MLRISGAMKEAITTGEIILYNEEVQQSSMSKQDKKRLQQDTKAQNTISFTTEQFLTYHQFLSLTRISLSFMEPEDSSPRLQEPTTGPYSEPD
jgi:hypothetical protein